MAFPAFPVKEKSPSSFQGVVMSTLNRCEQGKAQLQGFISFPSSVPAQALSLVNLHDVMDAYT